MSKNRNVPAKKESSSYNYQKNNCLGLWLHNTTTFFFNYPKQYFIFVCNSVNHAEFSVLLMG